MVGEYPDVREREKEEERERDRENEYVGETLNQKEQPVLKTQGMVGFISTTHFAFGHKPKQDW